MFTFDGIEAAKRAKQALNGADIYSGCCTLKIEFAKVSICHAYYVLHMFVLFVITAWSGCKLICTPPKPDDTTEFLQLRADTTHNIT